MNQTPCPKPTEVDLSDGSFNAKVLDRITELERKLEKTEAALSDFQNELLRLKDLVGETDAAIIDSLLETHCK